ncbi:trypsin-like peptidase domain-containing protein [Nostoc sp. C110]|uniref:trypsin-like peptidase domain-containing protein n=1 Tax=Nostoc sp. C110 TaxID=3349876 RepID=UPI00370DBB11
MSTESYSHTLKAAIARIYHNNGITVVGAGFLVGDRYLLTCAHVITEALGILSNTQELPIGIIELDFPLIAPGQKLKAKVVFWQPINPLQIGEDIAGLHLEDAPPNGVSFVQLVTASDYWKHPFRIFGFPQGHDVGVWATGELRDVQASGWIQMEAIQVTGYQVEPGFSGAPVWDESLLGVVGMAIAAERKREGVKAAFMIPTKVLMQTWNLLNKAVQQQPKSLSQPLSRVQAIKAEALNKRLEILSSDFEAVYNQLNYTENAGSRNYLQRQLKTIEQDINDVELQLNELEHGKK